MTVKSVVVLVMLWVSLRNNFAAFLGLQGATVQTGDE